MIKHIISHRRKIGEFLEKPKGLPVPACAFVSDSQEKECGLVPMVQAEDLLQQCLGLFVLAIHLIRLGQRPHNGYIVGPPREGSFQLVDGQVIPGLFHIHHAEAEMGERAIRIFFQLFLEHPFRVAGIETFGCDDSLELGEAGLEQGGFPAEGPRCVLGQHGL